MYKQRVMPLFLALALCTTQTRAHEGSLLQLFFYLLGIGAFVTYIGTQVGFAIAFRKQVDLNKDREMRDVMYDSIKLRIVSDATKLNQNQIDRVQLSPYSLKLLGNDKA